MILIELTAAINSIGALKPFYLSSEAFVTRPNDSPANVAFIPALIDPGSLGVAAYSDGRTGGGSKLEVGEIVVANSDGQFDAWLNYGFDGRPLTIRSGTGGAYPADFPAILAGTVESIEADFEKLVIRLRDRQYILQKPVLTNRYKGDNAGPVGLEGTAADLKDKPKPRAIGKVFNISPPQVNAAKLAYQVSDGPVGEISAVYDRGAALTKGADYATSALMQAASPTSGTFITCLAEGYFRLGSLPAGQVTADVSEGRRNLLTWSEDFTAGWLNSGLTVTSPSLDHPSPTGTLTTSKIDDTNATSTDVFVYRTLAIPNDTKTYTFSLFLKAGTGAATQVDVVLQGGPAATVVGCTNLIAWPSTAFARNGAGFSSLTRVGDDGWYRLAVTLTNNAANNTQFAVSIRPAVGGTGTGYGYVWGAQLELAGAATPYLTSGATQGVGRVVGEVLNLLATGADVPSNSIDAAALDAEIPTTVGIYLDGEETFQDAMDQIAASVGAYYAFDAEGRLKIGRLTPPDDEAPKAFIRDYDCLDGLERRPAKDTGLPIWRATVRHSKNWTTQGSDLAGAVNPDRRAYLAEAYRDAKAESAGIKKQFLMAGELTVESLLTAPEDAASEARRRLAMHQERRDIFDVPVPQEAFARWVSGGLRMMDVVYLTLNRFGLGTGKAFRLIGVRLELAQQRAILSLWG